VKITLRPTDLMTSAQVAKAFGVDVKSVPRWAKAGKIRSFRTPGGHRRYLRGEVQALMDGTPLTAEQYAALREQAGDAR
jgi:excisionase family DNA binding protein